MKDGSFGQMGRLLERADKTTRIVDVKYFLLLPSAEWVGTPLDRIQWMALLKSASAYEMYSKSQHYITPSSVAKFLILDRQFPPFDSFLSVANSTTSSRDYTEPPAAVGKIEQKELWVDLCSQLSYITIEDVIQSGLHEFLNKMESSIDEVGNEIYNTFIALGDSSIAIPNQPPNNLQLQSASNTQATSA